MIRRRNELREQLEEKERQEALEAEKAKAGETENNK